MRSKILENSRELIEDAEVLLKENRFPRAFSLAHLACEEMAKLPMLARPSAEIIIGENVDWSKLNIRMRNHQYKILGILMNDFLVNPELEK